jgi:hypothetical protein
MHQFAKTGSGQTYIGKALKKEMVRILTQGMTLAMLWCGNSPFWRHFNAKSRTVAKTGSGQDRLGKVEEKRDAFRFVSFRFCRITHLLGCAWYWIGRQDQDAYGTVPAMNGWVAGGGGGTWSTNSSVYTFYLLAFHSVNPKLANLASKNGLFEPFISKMHHFTKTGSGQT